ATEGVLEPLPALHVGVAHVLGDVLADALAPDVEHEVLEIVGPPVADHVLVDGAILVSAGAAFEEAEIPGGEEAAVADLAAHEDDDAIDVITGRASGRARDSEQLLAKLGRDA